MATFATVALSNNVHYGHDAAPIRVLSLVLGWPDSGPGWSACAVAADELALASGDCLLVSSNDSALAAAGVLARTRLPLVLAVSAGQVVDPDLADQADAFVFTRDTPEEMASVFATVTTPGGCQVRDVSPATAQHITALSAEAARIADALARLALDAGRAPPTIVQPVTAALVRKVIRLRRERERYMPAEIFADPAWDMLLDLTAARLEGAQVPVSSLCIAAAVPTTTALRWIRSLTEAGLFERHSDPGDARRALVTLSDAAADGMMNYLRTFSGAFALR